MAPGTMIRKYPNIIQDQTLLWTCVAGAHRCVNSRYAKFKYTGMKSDYIQITQCNLHSKLNTQKYMIKCVHVQCVTNHNTKFEYKGMKTA